MFQCIMIKVSFSLYPGSILCCHGASFQNKNQQAVVSHDCEPCCFSCFTFMQKDPKSRSSQNPSLDAYPSWMLGLGVDLGSRAMHPDSHPIEAPHQNWQKELKQTPETRWLGSWLVEAVQCVSYYLICRTRTVSINSKVQRHPYVCKQCILSLAKKATKRPETEINIIILKQSRNKINGGSEKRTVKTFRKKTLGTYCKRKKRQNKTRCIYIYIRLHYIYLPNIYIYTYTHIGQWGDLISADRGSRSKPKP